MQERSLLYFYMTSKLQRVGYHGNKLYVFFHSIQPNINHFLSKLNILDGRHLFIFINKTTTNIVFVVACADPSVSNFIKYLITINLTSSNLMRFSYIHCIKVNGKSIVS